MHIVYDSPYFQVDYDAMHDVVVLRRHAQKYASLEALPPAFDAMIAALKPFTDRPLLTDVRKAPGNNDPLWETQLKIQVKRLSQMFPVRASLVATAAGKLQLQRLARERGDGSNNVCTDEKEALAYLAAHRRS